MVSLRFVFAISAASIALAQQRSAETIVFVHAPDGGPPIPVQDIWSMDADGTNIRALTSDGHSQNPAWSPDGQHVLFVHNSAQGRRPVELYVMDRDGGNPHLLRRMESGIFSAVWSPDGKAIAISLGVPQGALANTQSGGDPVRAGLFLLPADGQGEPRLLFRNALTPAWSPDGKKLAFSVEAPRGQWAVHVANSDGSNDVQLTDPLLMAGSATWSPDGKLLAFNQSIGFNRQILIMVPDGSHRRQITEGSTWSCEHPSWSPDGKRLVFGCRSASPCGGVSSVGTVLPECTRRLFTISPFEPNAKPIQLGDHDAAQPAFAPTR